jgi:hypothetical protein
MKNRWIKICTVWPNERVNLWIYTDLIKYRELLQRTVQFPFQDRTKIDGLKRIVVKLYAQSGRPCCNICQFDNNSSR